MTRVCHQHKHSGSQDTVEPAGDSSESIADTGSAIKGPDSKALDLATLTALAMPAHDQSQLQTSQPLLSGKTETVQQRDATRLNIIVSACLVGRVHTDQPGADDHADEELSKDCNGGQLSRTWSEGGVYCTHH